MQSSFNNNSNSKQKSGVLQHSNASLPSSSVNNDNVRVKRTPLFTTYTGLVFLGALLRALYYGIPWTTWGVQFNPTADMTRYTEEWWMLYTSLWMYACGEAAFYASFVVLVAFWAAVCDDRDYVSSRLLLALIGGYAVFTLTCDVLGLQQIDANHVVEPI